MGMNSASKKNYKEAINEQLEQRSCLDSIEYVRLASIYSKEYINGSRLHPVDGIISFINSCNVSNRCKADTINRILSPYYAFIINYIIRSEWRKIMVNRTVADRNKYRICSTVLESNERLQEATNKHVGIRAIFGDDNNIKLEVIKKNFYYTLDANGDIRIDKKSVETTFDKINMEFVTEPGKLAYQFTRLACITDIDTIMKFMGE